MTLGQNVRNASIPKPTGFGLGSWVTPNPARRMTVNNGPLPIKNRINPIQNNLERRNPGRGGCSISGGWPDSEEGIVSMREGVFPVWQGGCQGSPHVPRSASYLLYTKTMPSLSIVKLLPSMVPMVIPAPRHCIVSLEPSLV